MHTLKINSDLKSLLKNALYEDSPQGDITSEFCISKAMKSHAVILARQDGILCGTEIAKTVFQLVDHTLQVKILKHDGCRIRRNQAIMSIAGKTRSILKAERVVLNFLTHLSGISTFTNQFAEKIKGTGAKILSTRKTLPGLRHLEKYAVRCGDGANHRVSLSDQVLIKDNHLKALKTCGHSLKKAFLLMRKKMPRIPVQIEITSLKQLNSVLSLCPDMIMFDNMSVQDIRRGIRRVKHYKGCQPLLEVSGGVNLSTVHSLAKTGIDRISIGALTHSAPALDMALEIK